MTQRHPIQSDRTMLVTTVTKDRIPIFKDNANAREAIETLYRVQALHPFFLYGFVIMPDHCHFLLHVPSPNTIAKVMTVFKSGCTFNLGIKKMWQSRFYIRYIDTKENALSYIHRNPISAGLVEIPADYPWSSASGRWDVSPLAIP